MKWVYAIACVLGLALPYRYLLPFVASHGIDVPLFGREMFASHVATFFAADVIVSSLVLWAFIYHETRTRAVGYWWLCIPANLAVGVSLAFPLFLLLREIKRVKVGK